MYIFHIISKRSIQLRIISEGSFFNCHQPACFADYNFFQIGAFFKSVISDFFDRVRKNNLPDILVIGKCFRTDNPDSIRNGNYFIHSIIFCQNIDIDLKFRDFLCRFINKYFFGNHILGRFRFFSGCRDRILCRSQIFCRRRFRILRRHRIFCRRRFRIFCRSRIFCRNRFRILCRNRIFCRRRSWFFTQIRFFCNLCRVFKVIISHHAGRNNRENHGESKKKT